MRESTNKKIMRKEILFVTTHRSKTISIFNSRSLLPIKIIEFCNTGLLKHIKLTNKSSVKVLRVFYLSLLGEKKI